MNKIKCNICGETKGIQGFPIHLKVHDVSYKDYIRNNINDFPLWGYCEICGELTKSDEERNAIVCSHKCWGIYQSSYMTGSNSPLYGRTLDDEHKNNLSKSIKKHYSDPTNHPMYGKEHTKESKIKMSEARERWHEDNEHPQGMLGKKHSDETKKMFSKNRKGDKNGMYGKTHTKEALEKIFVKRSNTSAEKIVVDILDEYEIEYHEQFFLQTDDGNYKSYDFKIKGENILIEVDGDYWHGGPACDKYFYKLDEVKENDKLKDKLAEDNNYILERVWESELKNDPTVLIDKLEFHTDGI